MKIEKTDNTYRIANVGSKAALFIYGISEKGDAVIIENNYETVFPGEFKTFKVRNINCKNNEDCSDIPIEWSFFNSQVVMR